MSNLSNFPSITETFEATDPTVVVHHRGRFLGLGTIKTLYHGRKVIVGFTGVYPSRTREDTYRILDILEEQIFNQGIDQGSVMFKNVSVSWRVR
jgi:hypothetical protein